MQMIYLLHSQLDPELVARLQRRFGDWLGSGARPDSQNDGSQAPSALARFKLDITEFEILEDLHFGRAA